MIAAIVVICAAGTDVSAEVAEIRHGLTESLDDLEEDPDWAVLVGSLRRILDGQRGEALLDGLGPIDTAVVRGTLTRLAQPDAS